MNASSRLWRLKEVEAKARRKLDDWSWVHKVGLTSFYANLNYATKKGWVDDLYFTTVVDGENIVVDVDNYHHMFHGFPS
jgi:hypothetical protein